MRNHRKKHFTLVEILVSVAVMIMIMVAAMPAYSSLLRGKSLFHAANTFNAAVMEARAHAIASRNYTALIIYSDADTAAASNVSGKNGVYYRIAEVYHSSGSSYTFKIWSPTSAEQMLPENAMVPFAGGNSKDFGLATGNDAVAGSSTAPKVTFSGSMASNIRSNCRAIIFKPDGQLAGTNEKNLVVRFVEINRYNADKNCPRQPLNINWLTGKGKFMESVQ